MPLTPSKQTGITHATMPVLVKELLAWQNLVAPKSAAGWPRIDDMSLVVDATRVTNVPLGESLMTDTDVGQLPPRWSAQVSADAKQLPAKKDREDPLPWLKIAAALALAAVLIEALGTLAVLIWRAVRRRPEAVAMIFLCVAATVSSREAAAKVEFNLVGYRDGPMTFSMAAREVTHRTSIEA